MNLRKFAAASRRAAEALVLLAQAFEEDEAEPLPAPRPERRARRPRSLTPPDVEVTPIEAAQAARILRQKGFL